MSPEAFEQLVSAWLDEPERDDLKAQIAAALDEDASRARVCDEYQRLHRMVQYALDVPLGVNWSALRRRIAVEIERVNHERRVDDRVDDTLRAAFPAIGTRVDWPRLQQRISRAVAAEAQAAPTIRFPTWRVTAAAGAMAAAAALVLMFVTPVALRPEAPVPGVPEPPVVARAYVSPPAGIDPQEDPGGAVVVVSVAENADEELLRLVQSDVPSRPTRPQVYFMIEPAEAAVASAGW